MPTVHTDRLSLGPDGRPQPPPPPLVTTTTLARQLGECVATTAPICLLHQAPVKDAREVTAQFKGAKYFGKADMYKGYFQLQLDEEAQDLLAIRTPDALYYPLTLRFGPASGPAQFQQRVSEVLGDLEGHGVASYIDDLGLYATTFEEYLQRLQTMLERLRHQVERRQVSVWPKVDGFSWTLSIRARG
jgi:hypothetical protein